MVRAPAPRLAQSEGDLRPPRDIETEEFEELATAARIAAGRGRGVMVAVGDCVVEPLDG